MEKEIFGIRCKGTESQLEKMYDLNNREEYWKPEFQKYFNVWIVEGCGVHYYPKEKYFVNDENGETNYCVALLNKFGNTGDRLIYNRPAGEVALW